MLSCESMQFLTFVFHSSILMHLLFRILHASPNTHVWELEEKKCLRKWCNNHFQFVNQKVFSVFGLNSPIMSFYKTWRIIPELCWLNSPVRRRGDVCSLLQLTPMAGDPHSCKKMKWRENVGNVNKEIKEARGNYKNSKGALSNNLVYKTPFHQPGEGNSKWHPPLTHFVLCPNEYKKKKKHFSCLSSALDMVNLAVCTPL